MERRCIGHENNFTHLDRDLDALEQRYDIGYKFVVEDPIGNRTGPFLRLYFSFAPFDRPFQDRKHVDFRMNREHWGTIEIPNEDDHDRLMEEALPALKTAIEEWEKACTPH